MKNPNSNSFDWQSQRAKLDRNLVSVFVYGTLKPNEANYQKYCASKVIRETKAFTWGQLFHLSLGYPAMTEGDCKVEGFVLTFDDLSILKKLDELEDYQPYRSKEENEYDRRLISVYSSTADPLGQVWSYLMSFEKIQQYQGKPINSGWWTGNL
jgi:gamma-glutamylcyclotransferase (GGCT)/AIG2-like uncharacterized protein YtfP